MTLLIGVTLPPVKDIEFAKQPVFSALFQNTLLHTSSDQYLAPRGDLRYVVGMCQCHNTLFQLIPLGQAPHSPSTTCFSRPEIDQKNKKGQIKILQLQLLCPSQYQCHLHTKGGTLIQRLQCCSDAKPTSFVLNLRTCLSSIPQEVRNLS